MKAIIIASVGETHPLYNVPFEAEITPCKGCDNLQVRAIGVGRYFVPENPQGLIRFDNGKITGVMASPAHVDVFDGYAEKIFIEELGEWITAEELSMVVTHKRVAEKIKSNKTLDLLSKLV